MNSIVGTGEVMVGKKAEMKGLGKVGLFITRNLDRRIILVGKKKSCRPFRGAPPGFKINGFILLNHEKKTLLNANIIIV